MIYHGREIVLASGAFAASLWGWVAAVVDFEQLTPALDYGLAGVLLLACIVTFGVLVFLYHAMIHLYHRMLSERDARIADLEQELREERIKHGP